MAKTDALLREMGGNLAESIGVRNAPPAGPASGPRQEIPITSPKDGFTRLRSAGEMLLSNIVPDPTQPRKEFDPEAIERLAESIRAKGLLQPLRVRWDAGLGKHVILVGERRYRAAIAAGLTAVPCIFVESELTEAEILEEQLVENLLREDLNPIEEAQSFRRYMDLLGCPAKDLALLLKISPSKVTRALSLLRLPDAIQGQLAEGTISPVTGYELSKVKHQATQEEVARKVIEKGLTADETAKAVRQRKGRSAGKKRGTQETFRLTRGLKVVVSATRDLTWDDVIAALEEALEQAKTAE
jgi:ParB family transcriptional regulator, chromosome partitioning protein